MGKQLETASPMAALRFQPAKAAACQRLEDLIYARCSLDSYGNVLLISALNALVIQPSGSITPSR